MIISGGLEHFRRAFDEFLFSVPPQLRTGSSWYLGTADAVFQNLYILRERLPSRVLILSGDHIYRMDYSEMIAAHIRTGAAITVAAAECDQNAARRMGVLAIDEQNRILTLEEKPDNPKPIPRRPGFSLVNMGVYLIETDALIEGTSGGSAARAFRILAGTSASFRPKQACFRLSLPRREGELLARCRHAGFLLRGQHGFAKGRSGIRPL